MNLEDLKKPFPTEDLEWRIQRSGIGNKTGKPWAMVLCYLTNRAIQDRLDAVCGPENWRNEFAPGPSGGIICGISIRICQTQDDARGEWVTKFDGAENTQFEPVKGGLSDAMKRAAVHWGIGRYLYRLEAAWAQFDEAGKHKDKIEGTYYRWDPPPLPSWAMADMKDVIEKVKDGDGEGLKNEEIPF